MSSVSPAIATNPEPASLNVGELAALVRTQAETIAELKARLAWFERQVFGSKSERLKLLDEGRQLLLGEVVTGTADPAPAGKAVAAHVRRPARRDVAEGERLDAGPVFDSERVPVERIELVPEEIRSLTPDQYEVIGHKSTYRLAQRPGSYVVLEYVRPVIKGKELTAGASVAPIVCAAAPAG